MRTLLIVAAAGLLSGCQTQSVETMNYTERRALVASFIDRCVRQGVPVDHPEMQRCVEIEIERDAAGRLASQQVGQGIGSAISDFGTDQQQNALTLHSQSMRNLGW